MKRLLIPIILLFTIGCVGPLRQSPAKADSDGAFISAVRNLEDAEQVIEAIAAPIRIAYSMSDVACAVTENIPSYCADAERVRPRLRTLEQSAYAVLDEWRRVGEDSDAARSQAIVSLLRLWREFASLKQEAKGLF